jgi:ParB-like chromosome segregation protein Spo0J
LAIDLLPRAVVRRPKDYERIKEKMRKNIPMRPCDIVHNRNGTYSIIDGNHRIAAARALGHRAIRAEVRIK